jgi:hypothetical protein
LGLIHVVNFHLSDQDFLSSVTTHNLVKSLTSDTTIYSVNYKTGLYGHGQLGFTKYFFTFVLKLITVSTELSWNESDSDRYDLGVILHFTSGFDYVTVNFAESFEQALATYTRTYKDHLLAMSILEEKSTIFVKKFYRMAFSSEYYMMSTLCKLNRHIYENNYDISQLSAQKEKA